MGGIGTLPMDYGQSLQVPQQQQSLFTTTGSATSSPLLNYGQSQLGQAGGTPLTRNGYQEGGMGMTQLGAPQEEPIFPRLETLNQNLGQAEQRLGSPSNNQFNISPMTSAFTGRPQMNLGGRMGYQEGGMDQMISQDQAMMQPQQQMNPPLEGIMGVMPQEAGMAQQTQLGEGDNALLTIIQLLIEQGLDPETAQKVARQILQAFAQGGEPAVEALANQFDQQMEQAPVMMATGGLTNLEQARQMLQNKAPSGEFLAYINSREADVLKKMGGAGRDINNTGVPSFIFKAIGKAIKSIAKSDIGRIALTVGATMLMGPAGLNLGAGVFGASNAFLAGAINAGAANLLVQGVTTGKFNPKEALLASVLGGATGYLNPATSGVSGSLTTDPGTIAQGGLTNAELAASGQTSTLSSNLGQNIATPVSSLTAPPSTSISSTMGLMQPQNPLTVPTISYPGLSQESTLLGSNTMAPQPTYFETAQAVAKDPSLSGVKYLAQEGLSNVYDYAKTNSTPLLLGTGLGSALRPQAIGESDEDYQNYLKNRNSEVAKFEDIYRTGIRGVNAANGGRIGFEYGSMPMGEPRKNPAGIMELDYRAKGGFVPPVGIKEKADDIPAMLSNNEFVFTADAVRNAGGGNVNKGAQRMYGLMKQLEAGGRV
jgi:hypothetical protein